jgi:hypothetical protein
MKTLILVALLLVHAVPAHASDPATCTGRVRIDVVKDNEGLHIKGEKIFNVGGCEFSRPLQKRILRTCPMGSRCRVEGFFSGDADVETITSVTRERSKPPRCEPVPMDGKGWLGVGGWRYATKACAMGPRVRPKDRILEQLH